MGRDREGELWDDSALINAFDDAMSKYKKMHGLIKKHQDVGTSNAAAEADTSGIGEEEDDDETRGDAARAVDDRSNVTIDYDKELGNTRDVELFKENRFADSIGQESYVSPSNDQHAHSYDGYSHSQGTEDYNQLLSQYYEIEEKRQKVLEQLNQFGGYYYQYSAEGSGFDARWGTCSTSQAHVVPASQTSLPAVLCSCCVCACHCPAAACPFPACSAGEKCVDKGCAESSSLAAPGKSSPGIENVVVKTAMEAVERAISSMNVKTSGDSGIKEKESGKDTKGEAAQGSSSETDLSTVLKAWYSAGFYTGKYLTEQSITRK